MPLHGCSLVCLSICHCLTGTVRGCGDFSVTKRHGVHFGVRFRAVSICIQTTSLGLEIMSTILDAVSYLKDFELERILNDGEYVFIRRRM